jgi:hypothetical protein
LGLHGNPKEAGEKLDAEAAEKAAENGVAAGDGDGNALCDVRGMSVAALQVMCDIHMCVYIDIYRYI